MRTPLKIDTRVRSLRSYLDEFEKGAFQVPSFQREFLWDTEAIKQLFDSIKNRYPIGSIQFWQPAEFGEIWLDNDVKIGPYKIIQPSNEPKPIFILDGLQRLSSLFGCLINPEKYNKNRLNLDEETYNDKFRIYYDLEEQSFEYIRKNKLPKPYQVPLYILINTSDFRKFARENIEKIGDEYKIELYLDRADEISKIITEYEIASVDILNASVEEAVDIFWRVNKEGIKISKDWIVNALTNESNFKLKDQMDFLLNNLKKYNFDEISRDILFNCIQSSFGKLSFDVDVVSLIKEDRLKFIETTKKTILSIEKAVKFLFEELNVVTHKLLPSNWQLIFIVEFFNIVENPTPLQKEEIKFWFWFTIYSNYFTVYNPSKRSKAFSQFRNYYLGFETELIYNDEPDKFISPKLKNNSNLGSVRYCAYILFQLNYYKNQKSIDRLNVLGCLGYNKEKLFSYEKETTGNSIYYLEIIDLDNILILHRNEKDLSYLLSKENLNKYSELFINNEMRNEFANGNIKNVINLRNKLILDEEKKFVESLNIVYDI
jgi:uncharacterized protein with ParB-like and HNH nuclease domain